MKWIKGEECVQKMSDSNSGRSRQTDTPPPLWCVHTKSEVNVRSALLARTPYDLE